MKKQNTIYLGIGIVAIILIATIVIFSAPKGEETIKIGVIVPLTGGLAEYGVAIQNGLELAKEDLNSDIELIFEDSKYNPSEAISAYNKLTTFNDVDLIINFGNPTTEALTPLVEEDKIPLLGFQSEDQTKGEYVIRTLKKPEHYILKILEELKDYDKIGIVKTENAYLNALYNSLIEHTDQGRVELIDNFQWGANDFSTSLIKVDQGGYDIVGVFLGSGSIGQFYKQKAERGFKFETFGTDFFESLSEIELSGNTMDGVIYSNFASPTNFSSRYYQQFNSKSQLAYAASSYDLFKLVDENFNKEDPLNSLLVTNFEGLLGDYGVIVTSEDKYLDYPLRIKIIEGNEITVK